MLKLNVMGNRLLHAIIAEVQPNSRGWMLPQEQQTLLPGLL